MIHLFTLAIVLSLAFVEAVSYPGFIENHLGISSFYFYLASLITIPFNTFTSKPVQKALMISANLAALALVVFSFLERFTYPNFVYTIFHLNLRTFQLLVGLLWFHWLMYTTPPKRNWQQLGKAFLTATLITTLAYGFGTTTAYMAEKISSVLQHPLSSYEEKLSRIYPELYPALTMLKEITPENATIYLPPQTNPWEYEGNAGIVSYFIYPRKTISLPPDLSLPTFKENDYILISYGLWPELKGNFDYGWPKVEIPADKVWRFNLDNDNFNTTEINYDPRDKWSWGLIKPLVN